MTSHVQKPTQNSILAKPIIYETRVGIVLLFENDTTIQPKGIVYNYDNINNCSSIYNIKFNDWRYGVHFAMWDFFCSSNKHTEDSYADWNNTYGEFDEEYNEYIYDIDLDEFTNAKPYEEYNVFSQNKYYFPIVKTSIGKISHSTKLSALNAHDKLLEINNNWF